MKRIVILIVTFLIVTNCCLAQKIKDVGTPYIRNYYEKELNASKQNWCIVQDFRGILYVANSKGVLEYDGANWRLIPTSKNSSVLSLAASSDGRKIFVGGNSDLGYLQQDGRGVMQYVSLVEKVPPKLRDDIKIYSIVITQDTTVYFCALNKILRYQHDSIKVHSMEANSNYVFSYLINYSGNLYLNHSGKGYCTLKYPSDQPVKPLPGGEMFVGDQVISLLHENAEGKVLVTKNRGVILFDGDKITPVSEEFNQLLVPASPYSFTRLNGGYYAFGTLSKGVIITDLDFNVVNTLNVACGMCDNRVTSMYQSPEGGLWITTYDGISYVDLYSPLTVITGISKLSSIGYFDHNVYIGSDKLHYIDERNLKNGSSAFLNIPLPGAKSQSTISSIEAMDGQVVCGTGKGIVVVGKDGVCYEADKSSQTVRTILQPINRPDLFLSGCIGGLSVYELSPDNVWHKRNSIDHGFNVETRHIVEDNEGFFWVSKKETGVYKLDINTSYDSISAKLYADSSGLPSAVGNYIFRVDDEIVVATTSGFYQYDKANDAFVESPKYNSLINAKIESNYIYKDIYGRIWISYIKPDSHDGKKEPAFGFFYFNDTVPQQSKLFIPFSNIITQLKEIGDSCYLIGCTNKLLHYDSKLKKHFELPFSSFIRTMFTIDENNKDSLLFGGSFANANGVIDSVQNLKAKIVLPYESNGVKFEFSANSYDYPEFTRYKCWLVNNEKDWSDWKNESFKEYNNLAPGNYTFKVKAINYFGFESSVTQISFTILSPWYTSWWAFVLYALCAAFIIVASVKIYNRQLLKDKQRLERIVSERTAEIVEKNKEITEKNKSITDSINYASRIQKAMLPLESRIQEALPEHFILFRPRDIVSGDFYWFAETPDRIIITAADCTGHGVPGAFMSMVGAEILTTLVSKGIVESHDILTHQNRYIRKALNQDQTENHDGMDMALCSIDKKRNVVEFTGAKNPLIYINSKDELVTIKADKQGIGGDQIEEDFHYTKNEIPNDPGTWYYMFSDGYQDQFGGPSRRKFMIKHMRELLLEIHTKSAQEQKEILNSTIEKWMADGGTEQTDDILVIGFKL